MFYATTRTSRLVRIFQSRFFSSQQSSALSHYQTAINLVDVAALNGESSPKATEFLTNAVNLNYIPAIVRLGRWKLFGLNGQTRNLREGLLLLQRAALQLDTSLELEESQAAAEACFYLGNAWLRMSDWAAQENALRASLIRAGESLTKQDTSSLSQNNTASLNNTFSSQDNESLTKDEEERAAAARAVIAEIKALRLKAKADREFRGKNSGRNITSLSSNHVLNKDSIDLANEDYNTISLSTNEQRAYYWFVKAAQDDHADAQVALGNLCMRSEPSPRVNEAVQWYELAAGVTGETRDSSVLLSKSTLLPTSSNTTPHPDALFNLGTLLWEGVEGSLPVDKAKALALFERAAAPDLQDPSALFFLGAMFHMGDTSAGIKSNIRRSLRLLELAAGQGHGGACHYLAQFWRTGDPASGLLPDIKRSKHFLVQAAEEFEESSALFELGDAFFHGRIEDGFEQDLPRALSSYERAASQGHVGAAVSAGAMYFQGLGTLQSYSRALERYKFAADQGSFEAWRNIASMHALGQGVPQSLETARGIMSMINRLEKEQVKAEKDSVKPIETVSSTNPGCDKSACGCKSKE